MFSHLLQTAAQAVKKKFDEEKYKEVIKFPWRNFKDEDLKRQFEWYATQGDSALPDDESVKVCQAYSQYYHGQKIVRNSTR